METERLSRGVHLRRLIAHDDAGDHLHAAATNYGEDGQRTGVMLLTMSLRLLHMNRQARELTAGLGSLSTGSAHDGLPPELVQFCTAVRRHGTFHGITTVGERTIVLSGSKIPDEGGELAKILVLMDEARRPPAPSIDEAVARFGLTHREETVVRHLALGYTNKEIGNALRITEQTVKEHMKHLMIKTGTTNRTGLLARILAPATDSSTASFPETLAG